MKLTMKELCLAGVIAGLGFVFSMSEFLMFLNALNPLIGLLVNYGVVFGILFCLSRMDLVVLGFKIKKLSQTIGLMMVTFAFFITVGMSNPYVQYITTGSFDGASGVFYQGEDGAMWWLWSQLIPNTAGTLDLLRILVFIVTPCVLAMLGGLLVSEKVRL